MWKRQPEGEDGGTHSRSLLVGTTCWNGANAGELGDGRRSFGFGCFLPLFLYVPLSFLLHWVAPSTFSMLG